MANSGLPNSGGSQFFIALDDIGLPPNYTVFGRVVDGFDVLERIAALPMAPNPPDPVPSRPLETIYLETRRDRSATEVAVDLHAHSTRSDGTDAPAELVRLALAAGLTALALTDHDTLDGIHEARAAAAGTSLELIPGVELSVDWEAGRPTSSPTGSSPVTGPCRIAWPNWPRAGPGATPRSSPPWPTWACDLSGEEVRSSPGLVGRPHIAAALVRRGHVPSMQAAFDLYLARGRPAYRPRHRLTAAEAVALARRSGGAAVLAHPHTVAAGAEAYAPALEAFAALGGAGVECHYPDYPPELLAHLAAATRGLGMAPTGGSDYHGAHRPGIVLGRGRGDLRVPDWGGRGIAPQGRPLADPRRAGDAPTGGTSVGAGPPISPLE